MNSNLIRVEQAGFLPSEKMLPQAVEMIYEVSNLLVFKDMLLARQIIVLSVTLRFHSKASYRVTFDEPYHTAYVTVDQPYA